MLGARGAAALHQVPEVVRDEVDLRGVADGEHALDRLVDGAAGLGDRHGLEHHGALADGGRVAVDHLEAHAVGHLACQEARGLDGRGQLAGDVDRQDVGVPLVRQLAVHLDELRRRGLRGARELLLLAQQVEVLADLDVDAVAVVAPVHHDVQRHDADPQALGGLVVDVRRAVGDDGELAHGWHP